MAGVQRAYPLAVRGRIIGRPFQGTHTLGNWQSDRAFDLRVPIGTPVRAIWDGRIGSRIGPIGGGQFAGIRVYVEVEGQGANEFYYAHLSKLRRGIKPGVRVKAGHVIGYSGSASGAPHLHVACKLGDPATKLLSGRLPPARRLMVAVAGLWRSDVGDDEPEDWVHGPVVPTAEGETYEGVPRPSEFTGR